MVSSRTLSSGNQAETTAAHSSEVWEGWVIGRPPGEKLGRLRRTPALAPGP